MQKRTLKAKHLNDHAMIASILLRRPICWVPTPYPRLDIFMIFLKKVLRRACFVVVRSRLPLYTPSQLALTSYLIEYVTKSEDSIERSAYKLWLHECSKH